MKVEQLQWTSPEGWRVPSSTSIDGRANLVFVYGGTERVRDAKLLGDIRARYPGALLFGGSTAGEIFKTRVLDDSLSVTAVRFEGTKIFTAQRYCSQPERSYSVGQELASALPPEGLRHVLVMSIGLNVNGSELLKGLSSKLPPGVTLTGGLAGDGVHFHQTYVVCGDNCASDLIAVVGLYGDRIRVSCGSHGGWDPFGPERLITRSQGNILYQLDGKPALELYRSYLGEQAAQLPASGLLFPLSVRMPGETKGLVRTILGIDDRTGGMMFAGDVPEGAYAKLMKANFDRLIEGATSAAEASMRTAGHSPQLALLISCVGRKMVLKQRVEEEVEAVREVVGKHAALVGFYSYGEISPFHVEARSELHNQTMSITTITEE